MCQNFLTQLYQDHLKMNGVSVLSPAHRDDIIDSFMIKKPSTGLLFPFNREYNRLMQLFDGKYHAQKIDAFLSAQILANSTKGMLLIVLIGNNAASLKYINVKMKLCEKFGIKVKFSHLSEDLSDEKIFKEVQKLFDAPEISGGIIQLPLPRKSLTKIIDFIAPHKDIDLLTSTNLQQYYSGDFSNLPPVVRAFNYYFLTTVLGEAKDIREYLEISTSIAKLKELVGDYTFYIIGNGLLVGKPLVHFLKSIGARIQIDENYEKGKKIYSDFLILGTGVPGLVVGEDISEKCNVIDFGTGSLDEKVAGDLSTTSQLDHLGTVALSPGGIGSVVVRFLLLNFLKMI